MKIKVTRRFIDRANGNMYRNPGRIYEAPEERARFLINLGLAEEVPEAGTAAGDEAAEAPQGEEGAKGGETPTKAAKTEAKGKRTAE